MKIENKLVVKNTAFLYVRIAVVMLVSLYTSRILLKALGVEDFGTYNVVGSIVLMFNSIKGLFISSTQRFLNYEMGKGSKERLNGVFNTSMMIHLFMCLIFLLVVEPIGIWFVNCKMQIPNGNLLVANILFQLSIASSIITILAIPYDAVLVATQKMGIYAYISILDVFMKLGGASVLLLLSDNRLLIYGFLMLAVTIIYRTLAMFYCRRYSFCRFKFKTDKWLLKEMGSFAGWTFLGNITFSLSNEGQNLILNTMFGPVVNAARAISYQIRNAFLQLISNMTLAIKPRLTHLFVQGSFQEMTLLTINGIKFASYLEFILVIPLYYYVEDLLNLWLTVVPDYSVEIIRCLFVYILIKPIGAVNDCIFSASGRIKIYQCCTAIITFVFFIFMVVYLCISRSLISAFWIYNIGALFNVVASIYLLCSLNYVDKRIYIKQLISKVVLTGIGLVMLNFFLNKLVFRLIDIPWIVEYIALVLLYSFIIFFFGFTFEERNIVIKFIKRK